MPSDPVSRAAALGLALCLAALVAPAPVAAGDPAPVVRRNTNDLSKVRPLRFGFVAVARPIDAIERIEPFRLRLAETLGVDVRVQRFADERALVEAFAAGRVDYAPLTASGYAMTFRLCGCIEPVAVPRAADGTAGWRIAVVTRKTSPIDRVEALAGRRLATGDPASIGGRRLALRLLAAVPLASPPVPVAYGGPRAAMKAMLDGAVDAAVVWSTLEGDVVEGYGRGTLHDMVAAGEITMSDLKVVWSSQALPHGPHAVRADLGEGQKRRLRDMLVDLDEVDPDAYDAVEPTYSGGFLRIGASAYRPFVDLVTPSEPQTPTPAPTTPSSAPPPG